MSKYVKKSDIVDVVQFNGEHKDVVVAKEEHRNLLINSYKERLKDVKLFVYIAPKPNSSDIKVANILNISKPFDWIKIGDYIITYCNGYSTVERKEYFDRDYVEINLKS